QDRVLPAQLIQEADQPRPERLEPVVRPGRLVALPMAGQVQRRDAAPLRQPRQHQVPRVVVEPDGVYQHDPGAALSTPDEMDSGFGKIRHGLHLWTVGAVAAFPYTGE